jgi:hypothetical protein
MLGVIAVSFQGRRHPSMPGAFSGTGTLFLGRSYGCLTLVRQLITVAPRAPLRSGRMAQLEVTKALPGTKPLAPAGGWGR